MKNISLETSSVTTMSATLVIYDLSAVEACLLSSLLSVLFVGSLYVWALCKYDVSDRNDSLVISLSPHLIFIRLASNLEISTGHQTTHHFRGLHLHPFPNHHHILLFLTSSKRQSHFQSHLSFGIVRVLAIHWRQFRHISHFNLLHSHPDDNPLPRSIGGESTSFPRNHHHTIFVQIAHHSRYLSI